MNRTLPGLLVERATIHGERVALREKEFGIWQEITWARYLERVRHFSLGMRALGLERRDRVAIIGDNRPEWVIAEIAAQAAGAMSVGIYQDSVSSEAGYVLEASRARIAVAEDQEQVDKLLEVRDRLPHLSHIVYYEPRGLLRYDVPGLMSFKAVEDLGARADADDPTAFDESVAALEPDAPALLCTTSGTTSKPKLAVLSHRNLAGMAAQLQQVDPMSVEDDFVSFLPLAWIGEQMVTVSSALLVGFAVNFPEETGTVRQDLREIGPQVIFSPPRIWENMVSEVQVMIEDTTPLKRRIFDWALGVRRMDGAADRSRQSLLARARDRIADWAVFLPLRDQLGLKNIRRAYTGGAALGPDVFRFFHSIGVNLKQLYGQTEVAGISVVHRDDDIRFQTVGRPLPGTEVMIAQDGEILCRGPSVFGGYFENEEATAEALEGGWLHSGDAGYIDEHGHLVVIDRLKDVTRLHDGTTFSPQFVENKLKFSPYVREAVAFGGDDFAFVAAIVAIDFENAGQWAEKRQIAYTTYTDLARKPEVYALIRDHIKEMNRDLPEAARIRRFLLLHKELHADDAELTRTRKVRRDFIRSRFENLITGLYSEEDSIRVETEITYQDGRTAMVAHDLRIDRVSSTAPED